MSMIAACGLDCSSCPAYVNRDNPDPEILKKVAADWTVQLHKQVNPEDIPCEGCQHTGPGRLFPYCHACAIRKCAHGSGYATCAECDRFDGCSTIQDFMTEVPSVRATLADLRKR